MRDSGLDVVLGILGRRKWVGLIALASTLSLGVPFALFLPNVYRGVATVSIENLEPSDLVRVNVPELESRLITIQQELLSRSRLSDLARLMENGVCPPKLRTTFPLGDADNVSSGSAATGGSCSTGR